LAISWRFWQLLGDIRRLIQTAKQNVSLTVNAGLTILYWQIGNRIRQDILKDKQQLSIYQKWSKKCVREDRQGRQGNCLSIALIDQ